MINVTVHDTFRPTHPTMRNNVWTFLTIHNPQASVKTPRLYMVHSILRDDEQGIVKRTVYSADFVRGAHSKFVEHAMKANKGRQFMEPNRGRLIPALFVELDTESTDLVMNSIAPVLRKMAADESRMETQEMTGAAA